MPANCPFCETNTHGDHDKDEHPVCERVFLTPIEVKELLEYQEPEKSVHVFISNGFALIGADWNLRDILELCADALYIELADPKGKARAMKHGISVAINNDQQNNRFLATNEQALKAFEERHNV